MIATGLDRLLEDLGRLAGRRFGFLGHAASLTADGVPAHLALARRGAKPAALYGPEHGYHGVEQDMIPSPDARDPWTDLPVLSLYGEDAASLRPSPAAFRGLDLLLVDLQDVGTRYYTFSATAVWAAEAALAAGCEVWVLDRPNPIGGEEIEGPRIEPGCESFVGALDLPVRHGLTLAEIVNLEASRRGWSDGLTLVTMTGWPRAAHWPELGRPWIAPSPNMPGYLTAIVYPGLCLIEATELSEGRGTTRPFRLVGAPWVDGLRLAEVLAARATPGVRFVPTLFRPQFQKHAGEVCGGVELWIENPRRVQPLRLGIDLVVALREHDPASFRWRARPYEFVADRPAIDLLTGSARCRTALESGVGLESWIESWSGDEAAFRAEREAALLYPSRGAPDLRPESSADVRAAAR